MAWVEVDVLVVVVEGTGVLDLGHCALKLLE